ncbi:MAG: hypothetical protein CO098_09815, partial [Bacteroidetes bacterium CG_4_9_14_3_um_filter_41_19]
MFTGFFPNQAIGEGSKELYNNGSPTYLLLCNDREFNCFSTGGDRIKFATYECSEEERLYFEVADINEVVYMGFKGSFVGFPGPPSGSKIVYQIKNLAGDIVQTEQDLPTSGIGYISNIAQAVAGPGILFLGGYPELTFLPPEAGKYYIEFNLVEPSGPSYVTYEDVFSIDLIDISIADQAGTSGVIIPGRVYSKAWQLRETSNSDAKFYVFSDDGIVTSLELNNVNGGYWVTYCNQNGLGTTSWDYQSNFGNYFVPQYKVFLNNPDENLYPSGALGSIIGATAVANTNCDGTFDFFVEVDKAGKVTIELTFPNDPVYTPVTDLTADVEATPVINQLQWDGKDGSGVDVPHNTVVAISISYINGLTNLPLYDVESNNSGFSVNLIRPSGGSELNAYWDDSKVGGSTNTTGWTGPGCHPWSNGNESTMNTYWYNVSTTTSIPNIAEQRLPQILNLDPATPTEVCPGQTAEFTVIDDPNTDTYTWTYDGSDATLTWVDNVATIVFGSNATDGNLTVYGNNSCGNGPVSTFPVNVLPSATITAGTDGSTCTTTPYFIFDADASNWSALEWSTSGDGTFDDQINVAKTNYNPGPNDVASGTVTLTLAATPNLPCTEQVIDQMTLNIDPAPTAFAGNDDNLCLGGSYSLSDATTNHSNSRLWTNNGGDGTFDDATTLNPNYTPGPNELAAGIVTLTLTANPIASCAVSVSDNIVLDIQPVPQADAGGPATICDIETYSPPASVNYAQSHLWTHNGDGSFDDPTLVIPVYTPGPTDITSGSVTLTLTCTAIAPCTDDVSSSMTLSIQQSVTASTGFGTDPQICEGETLALNGTASHQNAVLWDNGTGDGTFGDPTQLITVYTPGPQDIING